MNAAQPVMEGTVVAASEDMPDSHHHCIASPGERHGPFKTDVGCVVLEVSFPNRVAGGTSS